VTFTAQWQLRHPGSAWVFDYDVYTGERELVCFVCLFHHPRSHFTKLLTRPLFFWALSLFIYFRSMSGLSRSCCRWLEYNNIVRSRRSLDFVRSCFIRAHSLESELSYAAKNFLKHNSYRTEYFFEAMDLYRTGVANLSLTGID